MRWPRQTSSPCTRRCPQMGFSVAMRMMSCSIAATVGGRPVSTEPGVVQTMHAPVLLRAAPELPCGRAGARVDEMPHSPSVQDQ